VEGLSEAFSFRFRKEQIVISLGCFSCCFLLHSVAFFVQVFGNWVHQLLPFCGSGADLVFWWNGRGLLIAGAI